MSMTDSPDDRPVTVDAIRQVKPGCEREFEQVLTEIIEAAKAFEGHLGANVFRPADASNSEYRIVFKFDRLSHLRAWENSPIRQQLLERANRFTLNNGKFQIITGLETWFTLSSQGAIHPPPRYKMVIVTWLGIFPLTNVLNALLSPILVTIPPILRSVLLTTILVPTMTYLVMPRLTRLFQPWLYPKS